MTPKELRARLKALRAQHMAKPITKMSPEELESEIKHHESATKVKEAALKRLAKRMEKAKEKAAPGPGVAAPVEATVVAIPKKEFVEEHKALAKVLKEGTRKQRVKAAATQEAEVAMVKKAKVIKATAKAPRKYKKDDDSEMSDTDEETDQETIRSRIQKKKHAKKE